MEHNSQIEDAANQMQELIRSGIINKLRNANEAEVRLLVIDEVLRILGWSKHEYEPELITSTGGFTDYRLSIDDNPRLIVEAKRIGTIEPFPKSVRRHEYTNSYLYSRCGPEIKSLLDQCLGYCAQCGIPYALATTGEVWIVLLGFKYGTEWGKLKAFVFHSLEDILEQFNNFYGLVSREAIKNNSLEEKFAGMVQVKPNTAILPREQVEQVPEVGLAPNRQTIRAFFDQFMGDITRPPQEEMLMQCYVENRELNEFSRDLQQILQYNSSLDEIDIPIDKANASLLEQELEFQSSASNPKTILLVGNVGAGKSTFIHRFVRYQARPKRNICTIIDLINYSTKVIEKNRTEEQELAELVLNKLANEFQENFDPYLPNMMRGCFEVEINRFKRQRQALQKYEPTRYAVEEEEFIFDLSKNKYKHLVGYLKYVRKKQYKVWVTFDNVDRGSESYQEFIYSFAHQLSGDAGCITLITLRQDTFLEAKEAGFLDVRSSDIVFEIKAPEFRQVVAKRRRYVERIIERGEVPRPFRAHLNLMRLLNWHLTHLVLENDNFVRLLITTFSLNNIRYGLQMLRDYYTSYHSTFHEFYSKYVDIMTLDESIKLDYERESSRLLQALMLVNSWSYQEEKSEVFNIFWVNPLEKTSHFLMLKILAYLSIVRDVTSTKISVKYEKVCNDFISLGYQRHHVNNTIRKLLYAGLTTSPNLPDSTITEVKFDVPDTLPREMKIAITGRGYYYIKTLASHHYYQTRVGEDTIWYDEEAANKYISFLRESTEAQHSGFDDVLQATEAREVFVNYLKDSLVHELQTSNIRFTTADWARLMNEMVERSVFGEIITTPIHISEKEALIIATELVKDILSNLEGIKEKKSDNKSNVVVALVKEDDDQH